MADLTTLLPGQGDGQNRVTAACAWKVGKNGGYVWHWKPGRIHVLRSTPPKVMTRSEGGPWRNLLDPPFELSTMLRELAHDDAVVAGLIRRSEGPRGDRALPGPYREHRRAAMRQFFADVPDPIQHALRDGWCDGSWPLFRFLSTTPEASDLMASDDGAAVAWCLANAHLFLDGKAASHGLRRARRLLHKKRHETLSLVGLPTTKAALKALARVPRRDFRKSLPGVVATVLNTPLLWERAKHLPVWSEPVLELLRPALLPFIAPSLLLEVASQPLDMPGRGAVLWLLQDTIALLQASQTPVPVFASRAALQAVHDEALAQQAQHQTPTSWWSSVPFPPLPIELSTRELTWMTPLLDSAALAAEGKAMHHCLGSIDTHHALAAKGHFYAFALTKPERLTLAVVFDATTTTWSLYDLKGKANVDADDSAGAIADALLQRFQRSVTSVPLSGSGR